MKIQTHIYVIEQEADKLKAPISVTGFFNNPLAGGGGGGGGGGGSKTRQNKKEQHNKKPHNTVKYYNMI